MKLFKNDEICFNLVGGIGNQLFIYFAGQHVQNVTKKVVTYRNSILSQKDTVHKSLISDLNLKIIWRKNRDLRGRFNTFCLVMDRRIQAIVRRYLRLDIQFFSFNYFSRSIGFDINLLNNLNKKQIYGYFQSYLYFESANLFSKYHVTLKSPSAQFLKDSQLAISNSPIMLHIRRGDYLNNPQIGTLAGGYYRSALAKIEEQVGPREIWVFSDESDSSKTIFSFLPNQRLRFIDPTEYRSDTESLVLMSLGLGLVISNSTFSYWAGVIGNQSKLVIAPSKWFRYLEDPILLYPEHWLQSASVWEDAEKNP